MRYRLMTGDNEEIGVVGIVLPLRTRVEAAGRVWIVQSYWYNVGRPATLDIVCVASDARRGADEDKDD